jgi:predicted glutamine amidotransferase
MCIIIAKPFGKTIPEEHLKQSFENNGDGIGASIREKDSTDVFVFKYMTYADFIQGHNGDIDNIDVEMVVHFRWATHGSVCKANVHPFKSTRGGVVHHNGVISCVKPVGDMTDSETYVKQVFDMSAKVPKKQTEALITGSKLAHHTGNGIDIYNEADGHWLDGVWYSNHSYSYSQRFTYGSTTVNTAYGVYDTEWASWDSAAWAKDQMAKIITMYKRTRPYFDKEWEKHLLDELEAYSAYLENEAGREKIGVDA